MSGDWIKMRCDLITDPATIVIARATRLDAFGVAGRLLALWVWADGHTTTGRVPGVDCKWIDKFLGKLGFAASMCAVGWLEVTEDGVAFPHFDRHNGATGKERSMATKRQQMSRSKQARNDEKAVELSRKDRDKSVTREEKRREEQNLNPLASPDASHPTKLVDFAVDAVKKPPAEKRFNGKEYNAEARAIILFLNSKAGKRFPPSDTNVGIVVARLKEGFTAAQIRQVIAFKVREWKGDEKMVHYLRPDTLFGRTKFSNYVGELGEPDSELS